MHAYINKMKEFPGSAAVVFHQQEFLLKRLEDEMEERE